MGADVNNEQFLEHLLKVPLFPFLPPLSPPPSSFFFFPLFPPFPPLVEKNCPRLSPLLATVLLQNLEQLENLEHHMTNWNAHATFGTLV